MYRDPHGSGRMLLEAGEYAGRTGATDPVIAAQLTPQVINTLMITLGAEQQDFAGPQLFPDSPVGHQTVLIPQTNGEYLIPIESRRATRAQIRYTEATAQLVSASVRRYTLAGLVDDDEMRNAIIFDVAGRAAATAAAAVDLDIETKRAALVANDGNFGLVIDAPTGEGWNVAGTAADDINLAVQAIQDATGVPRAKLTVALLGSGAVNAALQDVGFLSRRLYTANDGPAYADLNAFRAYLGVKRIWNAAPIYKVDVATAAAQLYPDLAIVYYEGDPALLSGGGNQVGGLCWARNINWTAGNTALAPFYDPTRTSTAFPTQRFDGAHIFDTRCAAKVTNIYTRPS